MILQFATEIINLLYLKILNYSYLKLFNLENNFFIHLLHIFLIKNFKRQYLIISYEPLLLVVVIILLPILTFYKY